MTRHLSDEEILDLLAPGGEPEASAREHVAACRPCRERLEQESAVSRAVAELPSEADPPGDLWPALLRRLQAEPAPLGRRRPVHHALQAAAAITIFVLGAVAGRAWDRGGESASRVTAEDPLASAAEVQRAGTAYVEAVARFRVHAAEADSAEVAQARDVALAAVHGAAWELARLHPRDAMAQEILVLAGERRLAGMSR